MASPAFLKDESGFFTSPSPGFLLVRVFFESESGSESGPGFEVCLGRGTYPAKTDVESAFRQFPVLPDDTHKTYSSGEKQFKKFYYQFHLYKHVPLLPTTETILIYFAVFLAKTLNPDTIKVYLAAVRWLGDKLTDTKSNIPLIIFYIK